MHGHPLFASLYDTLMLPQEWLGAGKHRAYVVGPVSGRVLELGIGTGLNLRHYRSVEQVIGIDPDPYMLRRAKRRAVSAPFPTALLLNRAEALPFGDASFGTVVATLVFCTVSDPQAAVREVRRVLKPGGTFRFLEHVRMKSPPLARLQEALTPLWRRLFGGCHLDRDTLATFQEGGFEIVELEEFTKGLFIKGVARSS